MCLNLFCFRNAGESSLKRPLESENDGDPSKKARVESLLDDIK